MAQPGGYQQVPAAGGYQQAPTQGASKHRPRAGTSKHQPRAGTSSSRVVAFLPRLLKGEQLLKVKYFH